MWWGGGEPPDKDEGHMPEGGAQANDPGDDGASSGQQVEQELQNLQEQFASQQQLLGNLKSKLPQSGTSREHYETRLAAMRSRLTRPQQKHPKTAPKQQQGESDSFHTESVSVDPSVTPFEVVHHDSVSSDLAEGARFGGSMMDISLSAGPDTPAAPSVSDDGSVTKKARTASFSEGTSSSKIQLLRKQLDQNRSKFEKQQRDNREKKANMDEMKKKIEKLRSELEQRDEFIQSFEKGMIPEHSQPTMQQLCQQLLQKDTIVQGLSARVSELERLSQDQKEQLGEKNCIIDARTEAVALVTKDRDEKLLKMMEDLEERQSNMRLMQEDFTRREEEWRVHRDSLQKLLSEKGGRVTQLEENGRRIEGIRFELSTRAAELQEKVVALQSERSEVMTQLAAERTKGLDAQSLIKELRQKLCKADAHGRNKLKNLEKQVKSMKQEGGQDVGQQILELHNQIAVLEEEKGNLQLRLVDFDDLKSSNSTSEQEVSALHNKVEEMNKKLDLHSSLISALENEKIKLVEVLNDRELKLFDLESNIVKFEEENQEISNKKISQEKEMEELHDQLKSSSTQCESLLLQLQQEQREREDNRVEVILTEEKAKLEETVSDLTEQLCALKEQYNKRDEETQRYKELCELAESSQLETSEANQRLLSILTDKEDGLTNQSIEIDKANALISEYCIKIEQLDSRVEMLKQERDQMASKYQLEIDNVQKLLASKERELDDLDETHKEEAVRLSEAAEESSKLRGRLNGLQDALNETEDELANSRDHNSRFNKMVHDHEKTIKSLKKEINSLKRSLEDETAGKAELAESVSNMKSAMSLVEADKGKLEKMMGEAEKNLAVKTKEIEKLHKDYMNCKQNYEDCQDDLHKRSNEIVRLTGEKEALAQQMRQQISQLQNNLSSVQNNLHEQTQSNEILEQRCREWQASSEATQKELGAKCEKLAEYENEVSRLSQEIAAKDECASQLHNAVSQATADAEENKRQYQETYESLRNNEVSLTDALGQIESMKEELSTCANELESKEEMLAVLNNRLAYSEAALRSSEEKFAHVMNDTKTSLEFSLNTERQLWTESAERDMLQKQAEMDSLNKRLSENVAEIAALTLKFGERETNLNEAKDKMKISAIELEELSCKYDGLTLLYNQSTAGATALQQQISQSADELEHWKSQYQEREVKILTLEQRIDALLIDVQEKENEIKLKEERLKEKASDFGKDDSEKQEKIDQLAGELSQLRPEYEALKVYSEQQAQYQTQWEAWSITVQEEKTALQEQIDATKTQLENGTHELQQKIEELQEVSQAKLTLDETVGRLQAEVTEHEANLQQEIAQKQELELKLEQQLTELQQLQSMRSSETNELIELGERVRHLESELYTLNIGNGELSEKLSAEIRVTEELREQLKVSRDLGLSLGHRIGAEHLQQKASLSASGSRCSSRQSDHSDEQLQQAAQCRALQAQLDEALLKITQLETSLGTCSRVGAEREAADGDESQFGEVDLRDSLSGSPSGATSPEVLRLQQTLAEKAQLVEQMQEQLSTLKQTLHSRQEEMALLSESKQSLEEKYSELKNSNQLLHELLHQQTYEADEVSSRLVSVLGELASHKTQMESVEAVHLQHLQDQLQVQYEQYQTDINEKYTIIQSLNIQKAEQQSRIQELERYEEQRVSSQTASPESAPFTAEQRSDATHGAVSKDIGSLFSSPAAETSDGVDWFKSETKETLEQRPQTQTTEQKTPPQEPSEIPPSEQQTVDQVADLQYKLLWYEEQWSNWTSHYAVLEQNYNEAQAQILHLTGLLEAKTTPDDSSLTFPSGIEVTTATISVGASAPDMPSDQLLLQPTQVSESASQTVHGGPPLVETVASVGVDPTDAGGEGSPLHSDNQRLLQELMEARQELDQLRLRLVEETALQTQLRDAENTVQLLQTERQTLQHQSSSGGLSGGGSGRVAELELIVESAETEIARLRGQLHQQQEERERLVAHGVALETKLAGGDGTREVEQQLRDVELQLRDVEKQLNMTQRENNTLRSELEVMEGENSRRSTDVEILESENNRLRTDFEMATQSSQILEAEKESLVMEIQRLEQERERVGREMSDIDASREAANDQIRSLHQQLVNAQQQMAESKPLQQTSADPSEFAEEELDWGSEGTKELEHFQRSSSYDAPLKEEVQALKKQLIDAEKERNTLSDELQASKVKCGKLLQKLKSAQNKNEALQKDVERLKSMKGGLSDLDQALEDEYKAQVMQAQAETDELKQRLEEVAKEKDHSSRQCEVLRDAHDRFVELKEDQDAQIRVLKSRNKELESAVSSMEWKISELEEAVQDQQPQSSGDGRSSSSSPTALIQAPQSAGAVSMSVEHVKNLTDQIIALESQLDEMSSSNMKIESLNKDLNDRVSELEAANVSLRQEKVLLESEVAQFRVERDKASKDVSVYKEAFIQQQEQFEKLTDEKSALDRELDKAEYQRNALNSEYNAFYEELVEMRKDHAALKYEYSILAGERDRLSDDVEVLTAELEAFRHDRLEDTVRALEEEITSLRNTCTTLKEEATEHGAQQAAVHDELERLQCDLQYSRNEQEDLREKIRLQTEEERLNNSEIERLERQLKYCDAELGAITSRNKQLLQEAAVASNEMATLQEQVRHWQQQSQHLSRQVESADASLSRLSEAGVEAAQGGGAELEAALASLHLRDLRCHHLIMEINKLVEERDSLQLRLSSALRNNQEMQRRFSVGELQQKEIEAGSQPRGAEATVAAAAQKFLTPPLHSKLSELRELSDEVQQKTLASLPPSPFSSRTAPNSPSSGIITPEYTLTRETQATSSTLINWIMGRTTPRVMHI